jgi:hypothetical protein
VRSIRFASLSRECTIMPPVGSVTCGGSPKPWRHNGREAGYLK